jgi:hypothetical protein
LASAAISATAWKSLSVETMTPTFSDLILAASSSKATVLSSNDWRSTTSRFSALSCSTAPSVKPLP